jgi:hypothetical protein
VTRVRFATGDLLRARDLDADVAAEAHHRARHVRAAHRVWGVVIGLDVGLAAQGAAAVVGPGLAYDACGRELLSGGRRRLRAPRRASGSAVELVLADGRCGVELRWRDAGAPPREGVVLAGATVVGGALTSLDRSVRRTARPLAGGCVGRGVFDAELALGVFGTLTVDTSAAGFTSTPRYVATLVERPETGFAALGPAWRRVRGPFLAVHDEARESFAVDVRLAVRSAGRGTPELDSANLPDQLDVSIAWMGVEPPERCPPPARRR